jgi:hypothetical protein
MNDFFFTQSELKQNYSHVKNTLIGNNISFVKDNYTDASGVICRHVFKRDIGTSDITVGYLVKLNDLPHKRFFYPSYTIK